MTATAHETKPEPVETLERERADKANKLRERYRSDLLDLYVDLSYRTAELKAAHDGKAEVLASEYKEALSESKGRYDEKVSRLTE